MDLRPVFAASATLASYPVAMNKLNNRYQAQKVQGPLSVNCQALPEKLEQINETNQYLLEIDEDCAELPRSQWNVTDDDYMIATPDGNGGFTYNYYSSTTYSCPYKDRTDYKQADKAHRQAKNDYRQTERACNRDKGSRTFAGLVGLGVMGGLAALGSAVYLCQSLNSLFSKRNQYEPIVNEPEYPVVLEV